MCKLLTYRPFHIGLLFLLIPISDILAQRISFRAFAGEGIILDSPQGISPALNFNGKRRIVVPNTPEKIIIGKGEEDQAYSVVYRIQAAEGFDIQVDVTSSDKLRLVGDSDPNSANNVPFTLRVSYENRGSPNLSIARANSIDLPFGFSSVIIPVKSRNSGPPGPPPDPFSGDFSSRAKGTVYLFIYGEAGPVGEVQAGDYRTDILINVNYASYPDE